ncbi:VapE family protein [Metasolibacillus meyeri]|uniref:VapE family protein n=1 Tax=Metasolibacillus meyeri TaxID=1071052 RepID=A0AAW9NTV7_9BACL|nr:VapE domain-containing protein [Metasolibacillus meyeri]MEC1177638.1 VapE family protein [Metasolibacillus meyeri]
MQFNRQLIISSAGSRKATVWPAQRLYWSEFVEKLKSPVRSTESLDDYMKMLKSQQDELKDVGGFVAGELLNNRRKASNVLSRDIVTLDLDNIPSSGTQDVLRRLEGLGCAYVSYSTRKHHESKPRLRVLVPTDRTMSADEYEPIARKLASLIGIELADPTTFEASRLMYWPSCSSDSAYVFQFADKPFLSAEGVLKMYGDWRNIQEWPEVPGAGQMHVRLAAKQGNPLEKRGVIGAFCRKYDIHAAIESFLPGVYTPTDDGSGRYTFIGGSTAGGAVIYEDGLFLYSHHATDPCSSKLVNAFDLVRLHKFGDADDEAKPDTPVNKLPSFVQMSRFAVELDAVKSELAKEKFKSALDDFGNPTEEGVDWATKLEFNPNTGKYVACVENVLILLENDLELKGRIKKNIFNHKIIGTAPLPWSPRNTETGDFNWTDDDEVGLQNYVSKKLEFRNKDIIRGGFVEVYNRYRFHPVQDYLNSLVWDGIPRAETMFIDWLGAEDIPGYTRLATLQFLKAMVKRVFEPGCEYQEMIVLVGEQGIYKSNIFRDLSRGWFLDSLDSTESKIVGERTEGSWIVALDELKLFKKLNEESKKEFISRRMEKYRAAFDRYTSEKFRQFVLVGTSNRTEILGDFTGDRRYIPILCGSKEYVMQKEPEIYFKHHVNLILAEAVAKYKEDSFIGIPKANWAIFDEQRKHFRYENEYAEDVQKVIEELGYPDTISVEQVAEKLPYVGERPSRDIKVKIKEAIKLIDCYKSEMRVMKVQGKPTRNGFKKVN